MRRSRTRDLVRAIWFGMFAFLCVPLLSALNWIHGFIGNYGWSIIALTVHHQRRHVPAPAQEQRVDAKDAGRYSRR